MDTYILRWIANSTHFQEACVNVQVNIHTVNRRILSAEPQKEKIRMIWWKCILPFTLRSVTESKKKMFSDLMLTAESEK